MLFMRVTLHGACQLRRLAEMQGFFSIGAPETPAEFAKCNCTVRILQQICLPG